MQKSKYDGIFKTMFRFSLNLKALKKNFKDLKTQKCLNCATEICAAARL
mgnify:FL=1